jgi:hypothetical protein
MTNETNNVAAALLTLLAAFEAERVALHNRLVQMEDRIADLTVESRQMEDRIADLTVESRNGRDELASRVDALHHRENRFDVYTSKLVERVTDLEQANRLRGEISGKDTDELEEIKERLDMLERADGELIDEDKVREIVDSALENATFSINL